MSGFGVDDLGVPAELVDERTGKEWSLDEVQVDVAVRVIDPSTDSDADDAPVFNYPLDTIRSKIESGDLSPATAQEGERDGDGESYTCAECGASFETSDALHGHMSAHSGV